MADNELVSKKMKQFLAANPHLIPPVASTNPEEAGENPEQTTPAVPHKKKKGFFAKNGKTC